MSKLSLPVTRLIHENVSILMTYAFSRPQLEQLVAKTFKGEWKQFQQTVFSLSQQRAEKACLELAIFLRYLDDEENISALYEGENKLNFGSIEFSDGSTGDLKLRDVANKIIHAAGFEWTLTKPLKPFLVCVARDSERWSRANVDVVAVAAVCGSLAA